MIGQSLSHFRITARLGKGGMGEVYLAEDSHLGREVAVKILPGAFAADRERLARFDREARVLASLSHPHIATVYEVGTAKPEGSDPEPAPVHFLVMEVAKGETLAKLIHRGPLSVEKTVSIALQIADAMGAAHSSGIIHRDLKPANVMVSPEGEVKILDFGLARSAGPRDLPSVDISNSPTITVGMTGTGVILGTAAYMSPEQARGLPVDQQVDVWAFGCLLFEMLSGEQAFSGKTATDVMVAILEREPNWSHLPPEVPAALRRLLRRCLAREPRERLHHMGDVRLELRESGESSTEESGTSRERAWWSWSRLAPWAIVMAASVLALWSVFRTPAPASEPLSLSVVVPPLALGDHPASPAVALSRDGSTLAYVSGTGVGEWAGGQIYLRSLDSYGARPVVGAEEAYGPFFSPDGEWLGFFSDELVKKAPIAGGPAQIVCRGLYGFHGASWGVAGSIVFASGKGIYRVSETGGDPDLIIAADTGRGEGWLVYPHLLDDGESMLFTGLDESGQGLGVEIFDFDSGQRRSLLDSGGNSMVLPNGMLAVPSAGSLSLVPFDPADGIVTGSPHLVLEGLMMGFSKEPEIAHYAVADNGSLAFVSGPSLEHGSRLVLVDFEGNATAVGEGQSRLFGPRFSPDGKKIAVAAQVGEQQMQVWIHDLARETFTRLTFVEQAWWPSWTPDGRYLSFTGPSGTGSWDLFEQPIDGSTDAVLLLHDEFGKQSLGWTPDGSSLLFLREEPPGADFDIFALSAGQDPATRPLVATSHDEFQGVLSPDGRWLAYVSTESGRPEIYLRAYSGHGGRWQVSSAGGMEPAWSPDGRSLYFRSETEMMLARVQTEPALVLERAKALFHDDFDRAHRLGACTT